jgi:hypothetical protein
MLCKQDDEFGCGFQPMSIFDGQHLDFQPRSSFPQARTHQITG